MARPNLRLYCLGDPSKFRLHRHTFLLTRFPTRSWSHLEWNFQEASHSLIASIKRGIIKQSFRDHTETSIVQTTPADSGTDEPAGAWLAVSNVARDET